MTISRPGGRTPGSSVHASPVHDLRVHEVELGPARPATRATCRPLSTSPGTSSWSCFEAAMPIRTGCDFSYPSSQSTGAQAAGRYRRCVSSGRMPSGRSARMVSLHPTAPMARRPSCYAAVTIAPRRRSAPPSSGGRFWRHAFHIPARPVREGSNGHRGPSIGAASGGLGPIRLLPLRRSRSWLRLRPLDDLSGSA
jgi:hypothetical protein